MKIVILDAYTANPGDLSWNDLESLGELVVYDRTPPEQVVARAADAEVVLTNKVILDSKVIESLNHLKYIGVLATGTNVVDLTFARSKGIVVTNIPRYSTESVVQTTFAHILNLALRFSEHASATRRGDWAISPDFSFTTGRLIELYGKTLGVVGFGSIGRRVAQVARCFGLNVAVYGPRLEIGSRVEEATATSLNELFSISDVVSLHCPLTESTRELINKKTLAGFKQGAWLINTGRGGLLNEADVAEALRSGRLGGVGVDVLSTEPPKKDNPLLTAPNCYVTPHIAWASFEARKRLVQITTDNLRAFLNGKPQNVVN